MTITRPIILIMIFVLNSLSASVLANDVDPVINLNDIGRQQNVVDMPYVVNITKENSEGYLLNVNLTSFEGKAWFLRIKRNRRIIVNNYHYSRGYSIKADEGFYEIYAKDGAGNVLENTLILVGERNGGPLFQPRIATPVRDVPYANTNRHKFAWYPHGFDKVKTKYLFVLFSGEEVVIERVTGSNQIEISDLDSELNELAWSVLAFPATLREIKSTDQLPAKLARLMRTSKVEWKLDDVPNYLLGVKWPTYGQERNMPIFYPSGIAFSEHGYLVANGDRGELIYVSEGIWKKYRYKRQDGMPFKISSVFAHGGSFYFSDNRTNSIYKFKINGKIKRIFGKAGELYGQQLFNFYLDRPRDKNSERNRAIVQSIITRKKEYGRTDALGIVGKVYSNEGAAITTIHPGFVHNPRSWYLYGLGRPEPFILNDAFTKFERIRVLDEVCANLGCVEVINPKDKNENYYIRTASNKLVRWSDGIVKWKVDLNSNFGRGLTIKGDDLLVGDHTRLVAIDRRSGNLTNIKGPRFANVVGVKRDNAGQVVVVDSDASKIYFGEIHNNQYEVRSILGDSLNYPSIVAMEKFGRNLYVLTSNPSYLLKHNLDKQSTEFLIGNGGNDPAKLGKSGQLSSMEYPNDLAVRSGKIYISEANHRIIVLTRSGHLKSVAGTPSPGAMERKECMSDIFTSVRGITFADDALIAVDAGNNRLVRLDLDDEKCSAEVISLFYNGQKVSLNYPTQITSSESSAFLTDQNNNRILEIDTETFNVKQIIGKKIRRVYQGSGDYQSNTGPEMAMFNTPVGVGVGPDAIYIADMFNGLIRCYDGEVVQDVRMDPGEGPSDYLWPSAIAMEGRSLLYVDGLTKRVYRRSDVRCS